MSPGMIPLQVAPQLLYPGLLPPSSLTGVGGKDAVSMAGAAATAAAAAAAAATSPTQLAAASQVAPTYLIPVPAQAYPNMYLSRPPK